MPRRLVRIAIVLILLALIWRLVLEDPDLPAE